MEQNLARQAGREQGGNIVATRLKQAVFGRDMERVGIGKLVSSAIQASGCRKVGDRQAQHGTGRVSYRHRVGYRQVRLGKRELVSKGGGGNAERKVDKCGKAEETGNCYRDKID